MLRTPRSKQLIMYSFLLLYSVYFICYTLNTYTHISTSFKARPFYNEFLIPYGFLLSPVMVMIIQIAYSFLYLIVIRVN